MKFGAVFVGNITCEGLQCSPPITATNLTEHGP